MSGLFDDQPAEVPKLHDLHPPRIHLRRLDGGNVNDRMPKGFIHEARRGSSVELAKMLAAVGFFSPAELRAVQQENAVRLLPRLTGAFS